MPAISTMTGGPFSKSKIWKEAIRGLHTDKFENNTDLSSGLKSLPLKLPYDPPTFDSDTDLSNVDDALDDATAAADDEPILPSPTSSPSEGDDASLGRSNHIIGSLAPISTSSTASPLELILTSVGVDPFTCEVDYWHPMTWLAAMEKETYKITDRIQLPEGCPDIYSTWVIQVKRKPDGTSIKKKARFRAGGDIPELADIRIY